MILFLNFFVFFYLSATNESAVVEMDDSEAAKRKEETILRLLGTFKARGATFLAFQGDFLQ